MTRRNWFHRIVCFATLLGTLSGCMPQQPFYLFEDGDLSHYIERATEIDYPDVNEPRLAEVDGALPPLSLQNTEPKEVWELTLEEAVQTALANNKVMRSIGGQIMGPPDFLVRNPELAPTVYDPAIVESDPRQGVEAALAAFDAQFSTSVFWEKRDTPQNVAGFVTAFRPAVFEQDLGNFTAQIQKTAATGGTWTVRHNANYVWDNSSSKAYPSDWNVNMEAEMRQPLLQGAGVQFNRIAGPGAIPGFYNGVMIARINTDIALADFEAGVRDLVGDVEIAYWELYYAYRQLDAVIAGRDSALVTWRRIYTLYKEGARGGEAEKEAQAREQYFQFRSAVEESLQSLYNAEAKLRYLMGLAVTDGRLIRPANEPTTAKIVFDWHEALNEALVRNTELREQRWLVKRRELELIASKNFLLPRLDAVGRYRWLGLGDELIESERSGLSFLDDGSNAWEVMTGGDYQEWQLGLEFSMPIGFRQEMAGVRNAQLYLARERAKLQEQELELSHQLAYYLRELESTYVLTQTNWNRRVAAQRQVDSVAQAYETGTVTIDVLLEAQRRLAVAESDYFRSLVDYNEAVTQVHLRKGTLLEYNGVFLAEGPWPAKAYFDAHRRARARDASIYLDYGYTRPSVVSRGAVNQTIDGATVYGSEGVMLDADGMTMPPEMLDGPEPVPTPEPTPLNPDDDLPEPPEPSSEPQVSARPARKPGSPTMALQSRSRGGQSLRPVRGTFKLESLDGLSSLSGREATARGTAAKPATAVQDNSSESGGGWTSVRRAAFEQLAATPDEGSKATSSSSSSIKWVSARPAPPAKAPTTTGEARSYPSSTATDRAASGWQGTHR